MTIAQLVDAEYQQSKTTRLAQKLFDIIADTNYEMEDVLEMQLFEFEKKLNVSIENDI